MTLLLFFPPEERERESGERETYVGDVEMPVLMGKASEEISSSHEEGTSDEDGSGTKGVDEEDDGRPADEERSGADGTDPGEVVCIGAVEGSGAVEKVGKDAPVKVDA